MIYTVTFNPAIDYVMRTEQLTAGTVNRAVSEELYFGGKGINVSAVLAELGVPSRALGFTAGFTGDAIAQGVQAMGVEADFVKLSSGNSRINVKIKSGAETELNGRGPDIPTEALSEFFAKLDALRDGDTIVLAGSVPPSLSSDIYERILSQLSDRDILTVVDAEKDLLLSALKYRPFLIKPNDTELGSIFGAEISSPEEAAGYAEKLRSMGARNVLVSMAEKGAILLDEAGQLHSCGACKGTLRNSVGAGDSMLAGFMAGFAEGGFDKALKLGTACGGATAFSEGLAKKELIFELLQQL